MKDSIFEVACPCCGAKLEIDGSTGTLLSHREAPSRSVPQDLTEAVKELKKKEKEREAVFQDQFQAQRRTEADREKRFAGLLKKQKAGKDTGPILRDFDLD